MDSWDIEALFSEICLRYVTTVMDGSEHGRTAMGRLYMVLISRQPTFGPFLGAEIVVAARAPWAGDEAGNVDVNEINPSRWNAQHRPTYF